MNRARYGNNLKFQWFVVTSIFYWSWLRPRDHRKSVILQKDKYISGYGKKLFSELVTLPR